MAWWLEGATSKHFGWVRNPDFWSQRTNGKNREKSEKQNFGGDILSISTDSRYFSQNIGNFVRCVLLIKFFGSNQTKFKSFNSNTIIFIYDNIDECNIYKLVAYEFGKKRITIGY